MQLRKTIFVLLIILSQLISVSANKSESNKSRNAKYLSLDEFITLACKNDRVFQKILIDELLFQYKKALNLPAKDIILSIKAQYDFLLEKKGESSPEGSISLSKLFPAIGTDISSKFSSIYNKILNEYRSEFTFLISQPIARNAFGKVNRLKEKITGIEIDIAQHQIVEAYEDYLATLIKTYYNWYSAYINLKIGESFYKENLKLLDNIRKRKRNKIALQTDVNKIHLQVLAKKQNLIFLSNNYTRYLNLIKQAVNYRDDRSLEPIKPSIYKKSEISFQKDYKKFTGESRTYKMLKLFEEKSQFEMDIYVNNLLPSVNLILGYKIQETGYLVKHTEHKLSTGLSFDFPFPGQKEHALYESSKINLEKIKLSSTNKHIQLYTGLKILYKQIENHKKLIILSDEKIALAKDIVTDETKNYSYGRINLNDLISAKNELEENKFNKIYHTIELYTLIIEWLHLTDQLITKKDIK